MHNPANKQTNIKENITSLAEVNIIIYLSKFLNIFETTQWILKTYTFKYCKD